MSPGSVVSPGSVASPSFGNSGIRELGNSGIREFVNLRLQGIRFVWFAVYMIRLIFGAKQCALYGDGKLVYFIIFIENLDHTSSMFVCLFYFVQTCVS